MPTLSPSPGAAESRQTPRVLRLLGLALWFGLVVGFGEGMILWSMQRLDLQSWELKVVPVSSQIVLTSMLADGLFFGTVAAVLLLPLAGLGGRVGWWLAFAVLGTGGSYAWLSAALTGRMAEPSMWILALGIGVALARLTIPRLASVVCNGARRWWLAGAAGLIALGLFLKPGATERLAARRLPAARGASPNVLLIIIDDLRADHLSSYGYHRPTTPVIDSLARQGVLFENTYSTSSWSPPSHGSILTGRLTSVHKTEWCRPLVKGVPTLGELLQRDGYRTGGFSANYAFFSREQRLNRGFMHFRDVLYSPRDALARTIYGREYDRLVEYLLTRPKAVRYLLRPLGRPRLMEIPRAEEINQDALRWIDADTTRPFLAVLNYYDVHGPRLAPEPFADMYASRKQSPDWMGILPWRYWSRIKADQVQYILDTYDGALTYTDREIGRLLAGLRERGRLDQTVVIITSDHGELIGEHKLVGHRLGLWRVELRVPLVVLWPGRIPPGVRVATPVSNAGLMAAILQLSGSEQAPGLEPSLLPLWLDRDDAPAATWVPVAELARSAHRGPSRPDEGWEKALVTPDWFYIRRERQPETLLRPGLGPGVNWADSTAGRAALPGLRSLLMRRLGGELRDPCWVNQQPLD